MKDDFFSYVVNGRIYKANKVREGTYDFIYVDAKGNILGRGEAAIVVNLESGERWFFETIENLPEEDKQELLDRLAASIMRR
jgi:hypothetical protein